MRFLILTNVRMSTDPLLHSGRELSQEWSSFGKFIESRSFSTSLKLMKKWRWFSSSIHEGEKTICQDEFIKHFDISSKTSKRFDQNVEAFLCKPWIGIKTRTWQIQLHLHEIYHNPALLIRNYSHIAQVTNNRIPTFAKNRKTRN